MQRSAAFPRGSKAAAVVHANATCNEGKLLCSRFSASAMRKSAPDAPPGSGATDALWDGSSTKTIAASVVSRINMQAKGRSSSQVRKTNGTSVINGTSARYSAEVQGRNGIERSNGSSRGRNVARASLNQEAAPYAMQNQAPTASESQNAARGSIV